MRLFRFDWVNRQTSFSFPIESSQVKWFLTRSFLWSLFQSALIASTANGTNLTYMGPSLLSGSTSVKSLQYVLKISRRTTEIIENQRKISWNLRKPMDFKGKVQNKLKSRQKVCKICQKILLRNRGGPPPLRCNIFWEILYTFCLLFNLFWTFPLKSIGFLRIQLIFRWFFYDFSGFSAYFQHILQRLCGRPNKIQKSAPDEPP